VTLDSLVITLW